MSTALTMSHRAAQTLLRLHKLLQAFSSAYWTFFCVAFCIDLGLGLFFFLFNLYLADLHFDESFIGHVMACLTVGNLVGTIPAMMLARRRGIRPLLLVTFLCTPLLCALRVVVIYQQAQLVIAFLAGMAMCGWPICFSPAIAKLTDEHNRAFGFSIAFATGIGLGTIAGFAGGYVPRALQYVLPGMSVVGCIRIVLLAACAITLLGLVPLVHLQMEDRVAAAVKRLRMFHPFLRRFLPGFVLWNLVTGSFPMFGAVYLQNKLQISLSNIGTVFSASELLQFGAVLLAPLMFSRIGLGKGIAVAQLGTAVFLASLSISKSSMSGILFYLLYFATQYMCGPGIYKLLMDFVPEEERSTASAIQNLSGAACQAFAMAITGTFIVKFGYGIVLLGDAAVAVAAALFFVVFTIKPALDTSIEADEVREMQVGAAQSEAIADPGCADSVEPILRQSRSSRRCLADR